MRKHLEEKELLHIGILGIDKGEGVTSLAVGMASYLQGMRCKKTAMLEMNTEGEFADIRTTYFGKNYKSFRKSKLGRLHSVFPSDSIAKETGLSEQRLGHKSIFRPCAEISLIVLKSYIGFSDRQPVEHLNGTYTIRYSAEL